MIRVRIYGFKDDPELKALIKKSVNFALSELLPKKRKLVLVVNRKSNLVKKHDAYGLCYSTDDPHYYFVDLYAGLNTYDMLKTLFHEMTHVKQFAKGELVFRDDYNIWKGVKYPDQAKEWNTPWEKDARKHEKILYKKFTKP